MNDTVEHKLIKLFSKNFKTHDNDLNNYFRGQQCVFSCNNQKNCQVNINSDPIYTGYPGEEETRIMVIAEAPSNSGNKNGGYISPYFKHIEKSTKSPLHSILSYFNDNYQTTPYFTDIIKCGYKKQTNKENIKQRINNCFEEYLIKEIEIINPSIIYCIGKLSYETIKSKRSQIKVILKKDCIVKYFIHYSNQATLNINITDKEHIIWKMLDGQIFDINNLSIFKKYPKFNINE